MTSYAPELPATHLLLVRHGQSLFNRDGTDAGSNSGLTAAGWSQARLVADWLAGRYAVDAIISSEMIRSRQTAEVIAARLQMEVHPWPGLEESAQSYWTELAPPNSDPVAYWSHPWTPAPAATPIYAEFRGRIERAMAALMGAHEGKTVLVVCHGGVIATVIRCIMGGQQAAVSTENTGVTHLVFQDGRWHLAMHNSRVHLHSAQAAPDITRERDVPLPASDTLSVAIEQATRAAPSQPLEPGPAQQSQLQALVAMSNLAPHMDVLDVGTGAGSVALAFAPAVASVVGVDITPAMLERGEQRRMHQGTENVVLRWASAESLPFPDARFDRVTLRDLLSYVPRPEKVLEEMQRVLTPDGLLVLDEAVGSDDPVKRATQAAIETRRDPALLRIFSLTEIDALLRSANACTHEAERYQVTRELSEWAAEAGAGPDTVASVRHMLEAALEGDAAGLRVRQSHQGELTFVQQRVRITAAPCQPAE